MDELSSISFPDPTNQVIHTDELRKSAVKASALVTIALSEEGIEHNRDEHAAAVTDATHTLPEYSDSQKYLRDAVQEIAFLESEVSDTEYTKELREIRQQIQRFVDD